MIKSFQSPEDQRNFFAQKSFIKCISSPAGTCLIFRRSPVFRILSNWKHTVALLLKFLRISLRGTILFAIDFFHQRLRRELLTPGRHFSLLCGVKFGNMKLSASLLVILGFVFVCSSFAGEFLKKFIQFQTANTKDWCNSDGSRASFI